MWNNDTIMMLAEGTLTTLYMTLASTLLAYLLGLPLGIVLTVTAKGGLRPNKAIFKPLDTLVNIVRSVPFLILMILVRPLTIAIVGKSYGSTATILPLTLAAAPFVARLVESSIREVDKGVIEAAQSMGCSPLQIIWKVMLPESRPSLISGFTTAFITILSYGAMAGAIGGGGLGSMALNLGYQRRMNIILWVSVIVLVVLVQIFQSIGTRLAVRLDKRISPKARKRAAKDSRAEGPELP